jgi:hypothetical protein
VGHIFSLSAKSAKCTRKIKPNTQGYTKNIVDNKVVIIDEAHNFISRIVNKLQSSSSTSAGASSSKKITVSIKMYDAIMSAENCRVVLLTGTPFINYPIEL